MLGDIIPLGGQQTDMFGLKPSDDKHAKLMIALDCIDGRFGRSMIRTAAQGFRKPWEMKQEMLSKNYTSDWYELIRAN